MKRTTVKEIAALVGSADGNCPCNCHIPEVCKVSEPFGHHNCTECWVALIESIRSSEESETCAKAIWAVLVAVCGASPDERDGFVYHTLQTPGLDYRFQGNLGFGGKVYIEHPPRVSCYREDENPERLMMVDSANRLLAAIAAIWE